MNAETKVAKPDTKKEPDKLHIWNALSKTDPAHTKGFSRAGGFRGTAIKPIWIVKRLTEQFGPCGTGWGFEHPEFQTVAAGNEMLVYCTATAWYMEGGKQHFVYGIGGDKVVTQRQSGPFCDDEAFKKAFTDALGNAFKFLGVGADVHMGLFEDSKYLAEVTKEFSAGEPKKERPVKLDGPYASKTALWGAVKAFVHTSNGMSGNDEFVPFLETDDVRALLAQCERDAPGLLRDGLPDVPEYEPLEIFIARKKREFEEIEDIHSNTRTVIDAG